MPADLSNLSGLTEPCHGCAALREAVALARNVVAVARSKYGDPPRLMAMTPAVDGTFREAGGLAVDCPLCRNRGRVLTPAGKELVGLLQAHING